MPRWCGSTGPARRARSSRPMRASTRARSRQGSGSSSRSPSPARSPIRSCSRPGSPGTIVVRDPSAPAPVPATAPSATPAAAPPGFAYTGSSTAVNAAIGGLLLAFGRHLALRRAAVRRGRGHLETGVLRSCRRPAAVTPAPANPQGRVTARPDSALSARRPVAQWGAALIAALVIGAACGGGGSSAPSGAHAIEIPGPGGAALSAEVVGSGPTTIVLAHGAGTTMQSWFAAMDDFAEAGYRVLALRRARRRRLGRSAGERRRSPGGRHRGCRGATHGSTVPRTSS